jgi:N-glycosylase/DNA lyase
MLHRDRGMSSRLRIHPFSLKESLECGQFFRFTQVTGTYIVQSSGRIFSLRQKGDDLFYEGVDESFLVHFFRLDESLDAVLKGIDRDPAIHEAIQCYRGLRLIRQDPWECLISYLCSSAKSISHIRSMIEILCKTSGRKVCLGNYIGYEFPEPSCIVPSHHLDSVGAGFRAPYLVQAGQCIDRKQLMTLKALPYEHARQALMKLAGVGRKVADCTLLYSLDFLEAFPMDTWIKRGLQHIYFGGKRAGEKKLEEFVTGHFGPLAGYAQLYLFHYWRHHPIIQSPTWHE